MIQKFYRVGNSGRGAPDYIFECPGCKCSHGVWTTASNDHNAIWQFNGDVNFPTVSPSLLISYPYYRELIDDVGVPGTEYTNICHSFITNGSIQFLDDCTHELRGQTVEIPTRET